MNGIFNAVSNLIPDLSECDLHSIKCPNGGSVCVSHYIDADNCIIYGNFLPYMKTYMNTSISPDFIEDGSQNEIIDFNKKGKCLEYIDEKNDTFVLKSISKSMDDDNGTKSFVVKNVIIAEEYFTKYLNGMINQQTINTSCPDLVPKIIASNIYYSYIPNSKYNNDPKDCGFSKRPVIQKLEENIVVGDFKAMSPELCESLSIINDDSLRIFDKISYYDNDNFYNFFVYLYKLLKYNIIPVEINTKFSNIFKRIDEDSTVIKDYAKDLVYIRITSKETNQDVKMYNRLLKNLTDTFSVFNPYSINEVLENWWELDSVKSFFSYFFKELHKLHSIDMFHRNLIEENICYEYSKKNNSYKFKFKGLYYSGTLKDWMNTYDKTVNDDNIEFYKLYTNVYNYFSTHIGNLNDKNYCINLMLCELCNFGNNSFLIGSVFNGFHDYSYLDSTSIYDKFVNYKETSDFSKNQFEESSINFIDNVIDKLKIFIATKYGECIIGKISNNKFVEINIPTSHPDNISIVSVPKRGNILKKIKEENKLPS